LFLISVIHAKQVICKLYFLRLSLEQWTQWRTVIIHRLFYQSVYLAKDTLKPRHRFQVSTNCLHFIVCQNSNSKLWLERTFQGSAQRLFGIGFIPNSFKFPISYFRC